MLARIEERNRRIWEGYSHTLEDVTHTLGGIGLGLLLHPVARERAKTIGWALAVLSVAIHVYADLVKPTGARLIGRMEEVARR